jgi:hypothetical protein
MDLTPVPAGGRGSLSTGVRWTLRPRSDGDGKYGRIEAINIETRRVMWVVRQRAPQTSGVLATAGGLVFAGALDRVFSAYNVANGSCIALAAKPISRPNVITLNHNTSDSVPASLAEAGGDLPMSQSATVLIV